MYSSNYYYRGAASYPPCYLMKNRYEITSATKINDFRAVHPLGGVLYMLSSVSRIFAIEIVAADLQFLDKIAMIGSSICFLQVGVLNPWQQSLNRSTYLPTKGG